LKSVAGVGSAEPDPATVGVRTNAFGFRYSANVSNYTVVVACTNLAGGVWFPVETNANRGGSNSFSFAQWTNFSRCFFRLEAY
jgi:hypothetical protein